MADARAKTINLLLYEGSLQGVISIEDSSWNSGELFSAPRDSVDELLETDACKKFGVYLLISPNMVYVGQASDLARRVSQHKVGKRWWESVVILTTKDDSLTHSDIDYIEAVLIDKAKTIGHLDCDNRNRGNKPKVDKFREVYLGQYLDEALFLLQLIGINVFNNIGITESMVLLHALDTKTKLAIGKKAKTEAMQYLADKGIVLNNKQTTYAVKASNNNEYWANPPISILHKEWNIILNNNIKMEIVLLQIPGDTFSVKSENKNGLVVRADSPNKIDLKLDLETLVDRRSGMDFSKFEVKRINY